MDVAAKKRAERLKAQEQTTVAALAQAWHDRHIAKTYKHPEVVLRVLRRHIEPAIDKLGEVAGRDRRSAQRRCGEHASQRRRHGGTGEAGPGTGHGLRAKRSPLVRR